MQQDGAGTEQTGSKSGPSARATLGRVTCCHGTSVGPPLTRPIQPHVRAVVAGAQTASVSRGQGSRCFCTHCSITRRLRRAGALGPLTGKLHQGRALATADSPSRASNRADRPSGRAADRALLRRRACSGRGRLGPSTRSAGPSDLRSAAGASSRRQLTCARRALFTGC